MFRARTLKTHFSETATRILFCMIPGGKPGDPELDGEIGYFMGKMEHGDYLVMVVISCGSEDGIVLSARRMNDREKRTYQNNISRMRRLI